MLFQALGLMTTRQIYAAVLTILLMIEPVPTLNDR